MLMSGPFARLPSACRSLPLIVLLACSNFLDIEEYDLLPPFTDLAFSSLATSTTFDLWELRETTPSGAHRVIASGGGLDRSAVASAVLAQFDGTQAVDGFDATCAPQYCFKYFVSLKGALIVTWTTIEGVREFLGTIDSRVEAAILAKAHGYHWASAKETAAIRDIGGGYELIVLALVKFCSPVEYDRFVLRIGASGDVRILRRQIWHVDKDACI